MRSARSPAWQTALLLSLNRSSTFEHGRTASLIVPRLYLADLSTARSEAELSQLGITHVVSVLEYTPTFPASFAHLQKLHIRIQDRSDVDILRHLETTTAFIRDALAENESNVVMVHCFMGVSRSATVVCAYLVATANMTATDALSAVKERRSVVNPNFGFVRQLEVYAEKVHGPMRPFPRPWKSTRGRRPDQGYRYLPALRKVSIIDLYHRTGARVALVSDRVVHLNNGLDQ
ncbi:phosphatases II [Artomyces pyxidatus]|uniref:Phosphatases II n=1 Tax=Artomyces pyxidatus TaxID=48021 RepID=A0ACB8SIE5_9AGAM|nr:phosphatases II [Artomyces pyxidatus]